MAKGGEATRKRYGRAVRTSHAKAHGLLKGELRIIDGLPEELRQGLFAAPRTYPVIVRLAHVPGDSSTHPARETLDLQDEDGLRTNVVEYFRTNPAEFMVAVQLCTDLATMPVENAAVAWPEDDSPYRPVARLVLPAQDAYSRERQLFVDENLSFCPAHSLAAHRPLGSIMRARLRAYKVLGKARPAENGRPIREPRSIAEIPA
jgi:hypothetical protein